MPTVLINSQSQDECEIFHSVAIDDRLGARLAVEHLASLGHTCIGYLGVGVSSKSNQQRLQGYQIALSEAGLPQITDWVAISDEDRVKMSDVTTGQKIKLN